MAKVWQSSDVTAGADITHTQYNNLRLDVLDAHKTSAPIGSISMWAGTSLNTPDGWAVCDGSAISRATYSDLYTLTGNTFGAGNGSTTFNLPDMRDRFVVGAGSTYAVNAKAGSASVTLSTANLAAHTHTGPSHRHSVSIWSGDNNRTHTHTFNRPRYWSGESGGVSTAYGTDTSTTGIYTQDVGDNNRTHIHAVNGNTGYDGTGTSGSAGSGTAHENRPPYIGLLMIIKTINE